MVIAYILANTEPGKESEVLRVLKEKKIGSVSDAWATYGDYDIILKIEASSFDHLNQFLLKEIRNVSGIASTNTLLCL